MNAKMGQQMMVVIIDRMVMQRMAVVVKQVMFVSEVQLDEDEDGMQQVMDNVDREVEVAIKLNRDW